MLARVVAPECPQQRDRDGHFGHARIVWFQMIELIVET